MLGGRPVMEIRQRYGAAPGQRRAGRGDCEAASGAGRGGRRTLRARRGGVVVQVALSLTFVIGFAALSIDVSSLYVAKAELQRSADASAMAAASFLVSGGGGADVEQDMFDAANEFALRNTVLGTSAGLDSTADLQLGRAVLNESTGRFEFSPGLEPYDSVEVTVRRAEGSAGGPVRLGFARLFGQGERDLEARAVAMLVPRDIAVVIDISGSMTYDSQLRYYNRDDGGYPNTRDVWAALDGPEPQRPYVPGPEWETEYAGDSGPAIGVMSQWGDALVPGSYDPASDAGLWYLRKGSTTSNSAIASSLTSRGYNASERSVLMSGVRDSNSTHWRNRCGVILGLASWRSGIAGGFAGGDGDAYVESGEVTWIAYPEHRVNWYWTNYIDWVQGGTTNSAFRYRYGLKTYVDFLLDSKRQANQTALVGTPELPIRPVQDAVQTMIDTINENDALDHMSLHVFATTAVDEVGLTDNLQQVADVLYQRQAAHYNGTTNIGGGLDLAINELKSSRARPNARKYIVLMSDGVPNVGENGATGDSAGRAWALAQAERAADEGFTIMCVSVGYGVDRALMQEIAAIGKGTEFYAAGNPEEYTEELRLIFQTLGGKRPVALIE